MLPTVVHCKKEAFDTYIGRPSKWGNPYPLIREADRNVVIDLYRTWVIGRFTDAELSELIGKRLGCWCAPKPCHGDVLVDLVRDMLQHMQKTDPPHA